MIGYFQYYLFTDANGNMTSSNGAPMTYDAENRLITRQMSTQVTMSYTYDGNGELVKRADASGGWTVYVGGVYEITNTGATTKYYSLNGRRVAMRDSSGSISFLLSDHLGSNVTRLDANGANPATAKYAPYGAVRSSTGTMLTDKLFTGQQQEPANYIDLYYYGARFYSTLWGRFMSADTSSADGMNRYAYARNNPVKYNDPTGHRSDSQIDAAQEQLDLERALQALAAQQLYSEEAVARAWANSVPDPAPPCYDCSAQTEPSANVAAPADSGGGGWGIFGDIGRGVTNAVDSGLGAAADEASSVAVQAVPTSIESYGVHVDACAIGCLKIQLQFASVGGDWHVYASGGYGIEPALGPGFGVDAAQGEQFYPFGDPRSAPDYYTGKSSGTSVCLVFGCGTHSESNSQYLERTDGVSIGWESKVPVLSVGADKMWTWKLY